MYVPNNVLVFVAAYAGAVSGMVVAGRVLTSPVSAKYNAVAAVAGAFAQSFDTEWALRPTTDLDLSIIEEQCEGAFTSRYPNTSKPNTLLPATYTGECRALIALVTAAEGYFAGQGIVPPSPGGGGSVFLDSQFEIDHAGDATRKLKTDLVNQTTGTTVTIMPQGTVSRPFRLPDISGTALVAEDATGLILWGQLVKDQGSNAGIQYSTLTSNRAAFRAAQYGANGGVPGVVGFKSRGLTVGALLSVAAGDVLWRATAIGVTGNDALIPLAGTIGFEVPAVDGIFPGSISPDFVIAMAKDVTNSRRTTWYFQGYSGNLCMALPGSQIQLKEGADAMQGLGTTAGDGSVTVLNNLVTPDTRIMFSIQEGPAPLGIFYVSARVPGVSFTIASTNLGDNGRNVAWQLWEPAP
jgi:hypothetical protein